MTNLQHLINGVAKAQKEKLIVVKNGQEDNEGYIVINGEHGYNISVENSQITNCTCQQNTVRNVICKHMIKVSMVHGLNIKSLYTNIDAVSNIIPMQQLVSTPKAN